MLDHQHEGALARTLADSPKLRNLYYRLSSGARKHRAAVCWQRRFGLSVHVDAAKSLVADPLGTRKLISRYQQKLEARMARVGALAVRTIKLSMGASHEFLAVSDGNPTSISLLDADRAGAEFEAWARMTFMSVLLDSDVGEAAPKPGHFLIGINAQTTGIAAVQAFKQAEALGITIADELEQFVENVRSVEPANIAATRQFILLRDISVDASSAIRQELVLGLNQRHDAQRIANAIQERVASISRARARTIARTEIVNAHANATLNALGLQGVRTVEPLVEFTLNRHGDAEPCPQCVDLAGRTYSLSAARGVIPVHPNCQCGWLAVRS